MSLPNISVCISSDLSLITKAVGIINASTSFIDLSICSFIQSIKKRKKDFWIFFLHILSYIYIIENDIYLEIFLRERREREGVGRKRGGIFLYLHFLYMIVCIINYSSGH